MKSAICFRFLFLFLFVTLANALRITELDPTHVSQIVDHHHHHHVDHDLRSDRLSHGADTSEIILPTVSSSVPDYTKPSPLVKRDATEDNNLPSLTKIDNDHLQNQPQVHLINRFNKYYLPGHTYNPHKCRHHLRFIAYYPRFIDREAPFSRNLRKGQGDHDLQMLDHFIRPHYIISRHHPHHHHHDHRDDQTVEEKTEMVEDQHEESQKKGKEHGHEIREKDLLIKIRKFLPYF